MLEMFLEWYHRRFSDPQVITLCIILIIGFCIIFFFHDILAPLLASIVLAYLLEWPTQQLGKLGLSRITAVSIVLTMFVSMSAMVFLILIPILWQQGMHLLCDLPAMANSFNQYTKALPEQYPALMDAGIIDIVTANLRSRLSTLGEYVVKYSVASFIGIITVAIYLVLVPLMVFFLLKDKDRVIYGLQRVLPRDQLLIEKVWKEMNRQITNYIRGKIIEMVIVGICTYIVFIFLGLRYSLFLSVLVGISALIPYIGSAVVTIPIVLVALFQWGIGPDFWTLLISYFIVQGLDGNLFAPILFAEAVNLHPLVIMLSVVIFGDFWGFWGIFFAIPIAILIKAVMHVWPENNEVIKK